MTKAHIYANPAYPNTSNILTHRRYPRPGYRPPGNPVLVGSGSYEQSWRAIPTHRFGGAQVSEGLGSSWNSSGVLANSKYGLEPNSRAVLTQ